MDADLEHYLEKHFSRMDARFDEVLTRLTRIENALLELTTRVVSPLEVEKVQRVLGVERPVSAFPPPLDD